MIAPSIALPTGPYDWHPERIPKSVYEARVDQARAMMRARTITHLVVHGNGFDHGALAWLTGFTPKLGPGYALIPAGGPPRLLFAGGPGMRPSAARLTWIADVVAIKGIGGDLGRWLGDHPQGARATLGLCEGRSMSLGDWLAVTGAAAAGEVAGMDVAIDALRRARTPLELGLIRRGAAILTTTAETLAAALAKDGIRTAALAAERHAYAEGAQDVRVRIGVRPWAPPVPLDASGGRAFGASGGRAFGTSDERPSGPVRVAIALRFAGYWADAQFVAGTVSNEARQSVRGEIAAWIERLRPGAGAADLAAGGAPASSCACIGIGLAPVEAPNPADGDRLAVGDVCTLALEIEATPGQRAVWSVMAAIGPAGPELLWAPPDTISPSRLD